MKETRILMDMPVTIEIVDHTATKKSVNKIFDYFSYIDEKFSIFKKTSEITKINERKINEHEWSQDMKEVMSLCEQTKQETSGYFNIKHNGKYDPSGLVKGWAINNAANILKKEGFKNLYVEAGGDIQVYGKNKEKKPWVVGIRNPFNRKQIVKAVTLETQGIATSGTYIRGPHIYNPYRPIKQIKEIVSLTVIGPNIYEADRFATAAFAMGKAGINFIESLSDFEAYMIDKDGLATYTEKFNSYVLKTK